MGEPTFDFGSTRPFDGFDKLTASKLIRSTGSG
jgi:hypothetical protein